MMQYALDAATIATFIVGHIVRDGWPATGSTHAARALGGLACLIGSFATMQPVVAACVGVSMWLGFYVDQRHGDGQGADNASSLDFLAISGVSSLMLLGFALEYISPHAELIMLIGLVKPILWLVSWKLLQRAQKTWFQPTRVAAGVFGGVVAAAILGVM